MVLIALSGHGWADMMAYDKYLRGGVVDIEHQDDQLHQAWELLPQVPPEWQ